MTVSFEGFVVFIITAGVAAFFALEFYYDGRDKKIYGGGRSKIIFHCIKCDRLFTTPKGQETAPCPQCGFENARLKF